MKKRLVFLPFHLDDRVIFFKLPNTIKMCVFLLPLLFVKMSIFVLIWRHLKDAGLEKGKRAHQRRAFPQDEAPSTGS